ncbi:hypothetical protein PRZ48_006708 [Zasmidium cellare]|uniref:Uncharacterized protein n=1 Tax=Zasmidium cellare TaxID=395010 RepID=A0ABR0EQ48_ZASCE|nr:hypothetical protein PRZ48_006708 [Zasmidium cellare]
MLDERHPKPKDFKKNPRDDNSYSWGRIGDHNIVIASLPDGVYGTTSAATTAACLVSSLPCIRVGLLVGIGAGITGETCDENGQVTLRNDVFLGDVVVSQPKDGKGGVVLHDIIKAKTFDGERQSTLNGHLNQPPSALLHALGALRAEHLCEPSRMPELLAVFAAKETMKDTFVYPGKEHDPLRAALQNSVQNITRDSPKIHYGTIASGNKLIKDGQERDDIVKWLRENGIDPICFEMEAGGLMNSFPCIVIRGICDYADERKNDTWQCYAAATAAAFAKELLDYLDADDVEGEDTLAQRLEQLQSDIQDVKTDTTRLVTSTAENETRALQDWLCSTDYTPQLHEHQANYYSGTVSWFFDDRRYRSWAQRGQGSVLLCEGHPGTGKSTLASHVIEVLQGKPSNSNPTPVLYLFFDHKMQDAQTANHVLRSLLQQLVGFLPELPQDLRTWKKENERLTSDKLYESFRTVLSNLGDLFVVLDALDEASPGVCDEFLLARLLMDILVTRVATPASLKRALGALPAGDNAYKLAYDSIIERVTSQQGDFKVLGLECLAWVVFAKRPLTLKELGHALATRSDEHGFDPDNVPDLAQLPSLCAGLITVNSTSKVVSLVHFTAQEYLVEIRHEWFPMAAILLADKCLTYLMSANADFNHGPARVEDCSPDDGTDLLRVAYDRRAELDRLMPQWSFMHYAIQEWPRHAKDVDMEPRCNDEHIEALSVRITVLAARQDVCFWFAFAGEIFEHGSDSRAAATIILESRDFTIWHAVAVWDLAHVCSALLTKVDFVNSEFAGQTPLILAARFGSTETARILLNHTCARPVEMGDVASWLDGWVEVVTGRDVSKAGSVDAGRVDAWLYDLVPTETDVSNAGSVDAGRVDAWLYDLLPTETETENVSTSDSHLASLDCFTRTNELGDDFAHRHSILWLAAYYGHATFVEMLLTLVPPMDCNFTDPYGKTPLFIAIERGHSNVVEIFLRTANVDLGRRDNRGWTPLRCATHQKDLLRMLVSHPTTDINETFEDGSTVLFEAALRGYHHVVESLLSRPDIDVNHESGQYGLTALLVAAYKGHKDVAQLLISHPEIDVNKSEITAGGTPLFVAAEKGYSDIVRLLLSSLDIDVNKPLTFSWRAWALSTLSDIEPVGVISMLMDHAMFLWHICERETCNGATALYVAASRGYSDIVRMLLSSSDIDVNRSAGYRYWPPSRPLSRAAFEGHHDVVRLLLLHRNIDIKEDSSGMNALHYACDKGNTSTVKVLLDSGAFPLEGHDQAGHTPLTSAAKNGHTSVIRLLAAEGANVSARPRDDCMALFLSAIEGHTEAVAEMLRHSALQDNVVLSWRDKTVLRLGYWAALFATDESNSAGPETGELKGVDESLKLIRRIPAVNMLFGTLANMSVEKRAIERSDQSTLAWYFRHNLRHGSYLACSPFCDCECRVLLNSPVFWLCSNCTGGRNPELEGRAFLGKCVEAGRWCKNRSHSMKEIDLRPLLEGNPSEFVYPFPTRTCQYRPGDGAYTDSQSAEGSTSFSNDPTQKSSFAGFDKVAIELWRRSV